MADQAQLQAMLANIQSQLATMNNLVAQPQPQPTYAPSYNVQPDIQNIVQTAIQAEMSRLGLNRPTGLPIPTPAPTQAPRIQEPKAPNMNAILPIIGAAFTTEQQEWISQPQNLLGIPGFLMSADGKALLGMMMESYQNFCKGNSN